jgi:hypothetical protein
VNWTPSITEPSGTLVGEKPNPVAYKSSDTLVRLVRDTLAYDVGEVTPDGLVQAIPLIRVTSAAAVASKSTGPVCVGPVVPGPRKKLDALLAVAGMAKLLSQFTGSVASPWTNSTGDEVPLPPRGRRSDKLKPSNLVRVHERKLDS